MERGRQGLAGNAWSGPVRPAGAGHGFLMGVWAGPILTEEGDQPSCWRDHGARELGSAATGFEESGGGMPPPALFQAGAGDTEGGEALL